MSLFKRLVAEKVVLHMPTTEGEKTATVRRDVEELEVRRIGLCFGQITITNICHRFTARGFSTMAPST